MVDFEFNALLSAMRSLFHKYPATFILYIHWSKEENLTKKLILQNIIMLLLFVYRSVHICVASAWGWLYTVQVYTAQGWLLARAWPLAPAPPAQSLRLRDQPATGSPLESRPVWRGLSKRKDPLPSCYFSCCVTVVVVVVLSVTTTNHQEMSNKSIVYHCYPNC